MVHFASISKLYWRIEYSSFKNKRLRETPGSELEGAKLALVIWAGANVPSRCNLPSPLIDLLLYSYRLPYETPGYRL